jgi:hypothetical protein
MNTVLLLWWLSLPLSLIALDYARRQQAERMRQAEEEEARRAANPFADLFRSAARSTSTSAGRSGFGGGSRGRYSEQDGPIIEASWTSLDDDGQPKKRK